MEQEPKATRSGNACLHGMQCVTKASIAYVATQVCYLLPHLLLLINAGPLWIDFSSRFFTQRPSHRLGTFLYKYFRAPWRSRWKGGSRPTSRLVEQVNNIFNCRSHSDVFIQANFPSLCRSWMYAFEGQCTCTDQAEASGCDGCQGFHGNVGLVWRRWYSLHLWTYFFIRWTMFDAFDHFCLLVWVNKAFGFTVYQHVKLKII